MYYTMREMHQILLFEKIVLLFLFCSHSLDSPNPLFVLMEEAATRY